MRLIRLTDDTQGPGPEELIEEVRRYAPDTDFDEIRRAYDFAAEAHAGQFRLSGEPYITHPLAVARTLAQINSDLPSLQAALLHDTVEDNSTVTIESIERAFGPVVAELVDGVTKLKRLRFRSHIENQARNYRKLFVAMAKDLRVIIIKLADRLHNMRTISVHPEAKQRVQADETLHIYAPLAHRLGMSRIEWQLEDLALEVLDPTGYRAIQTKVAQTRAEREEFVTQAAARLRERLAAAGIDAEVDGRPKHFYSIYLKMMRQELNFDQIFDLMALRVLVSTVAECYAALGIVHEMWVPLPDMMTDFIAKPKPNGYQSLHTRVIGPYGTRLEVQIRTWTMHRIAEFGVAAHWHYKDGGPLTDFDRKLSWLSRLTELQEDEVGDTDFIHSLEEGLFEAEVFAFTPKGDLIDLPRGATPVDFAYRVHTTVGHECVGARVNGRPVPLTYQLKSGDICEIVRKRGSQPSRDWLGFVQCSHTRSKIRAYFRKLGFEENVKAGRAMLEREVMRAGQASETLLAEERLQRVAEDLNYQAVDTMLAHIGTRDLSVETVLVRLQTLEGEERLRTLGDLSIIRRRRKPGRHGPYDVVAAGMEGLEFTLARCCEPLPGDPIVGYVTRGRGLTVHRATCHNLKTLAGRDGARMLACEWVVPDGVTHPAKVEVLAADRVGMLHDVTGVISEVGVNIADISVPERQAGRATMHISLDVVSAEQLASLVTRLEALSGTVSVRRIPR